MVALAVPFFTNRDAPVQVAVSNPAEAAAETDAPLTRPVHVRDARSAEPLAGLYQDNPTAAVARSAWTHTYAGDVGSCQATLQLSEQTVSGADWGQYQGRALSVDADGLASLVTPPEATVRSHLSVTVGGATPAAATGPSPARCVTPGGRAVAPACSCPTPAPAP